jgi:hypothetical protein
VGSAHFSFPQAGRRTPAFSPLPLPPTASRGPRVRGPSRSPVRAAAAPRPGRHPPVGTRPRSPASRHRVAPLATLPPPPISLPCHCTTAAYKKGGAPSAPPPPPCCLVHARAHPLPPSSVMPTTALGHRSHPLFDEIVPECHRPPFPVSTPLRALLSQILAALTFSVLSHSC